MNNVQLIEAVKAGDHSMIEQLIESGIDLNQQDEQGWTPLNWAAGKGDSASVKLLLDKHADPFKVGHDQRTPYEIALAAGHIDVVNLLRDAESRVGGGNINRSNRTYTRAYSLGELCKFKGWKDCYPGTNGDRVLSNDDVVYLHEDLTVTQCIWHNEQVIFNRVTPEWKDFCTNVLEFSVPDDIALCVPA